MAKFLRASVEPEIIEPCELARLRASCKPRLHAKLSEIQQDNELRSSQLLS